MKTHRWAITLAVVVSATAIGCRLTFIQARPVSSEQTQWSLARISESTALTAAVERACQRTVEAHGDAPLTMDQIMAAVIDTTYPQRPLLGQHNGDQPTCPASVIKVAYMVHAYQKVIDGELRFNRHVKETLREMIRVSSNAATQDMVDLLSGTTGGPRIEDPQAYAAWIHGRNATNRLLRSLGFNQMNACQKTWGELPEPNSREMQFRGSEHALGHVNGNRMTARETAELLWLIDQGLVVSAGACKEMRDLLERWGTDWRYGDRHRAIGQTLPPESRCWSKMGGTSRFFHDASVAELPDGRRWILVVLTQIRRRDGLDRSEVLRTWAHAMLDELGGLPL